MRRHVAAADAAADLVELGEPERSARSTISVFACGMSRPDSMIVVETSTSASPREEREHLVLELALAHLAVRDEDAEARAQLPQLLGRLVDRLDAVVEVERLPVAGELALERLLDELLVVLADVRADRAAALRRRLDHRDVAQAGERHVQRARDRRRADSASTSTSSRSWRRSSFCATPKRCSSSTITRPSSFGIDVAREDAVGADQHVDLALGEVGEHLLHVGRLAEARDHLDADREVAVALAEGVPVLLGEDRRRHEHQHLLAGDGDRERGAQRDLGLAEADVAADEPVHRPRRLEVLLDRLDRACLVLGLAVRELALEPLDPLVVDVVGDARARLALRRRAGAARRPSRAGARGRGVLRLSQALPPSFESVGAFESAPM